MAIARRVSFNSQNQPTRGSGERYERTTGYRHRQFQCQIRTVCKRPSQETWRIPLTRSLLKLPYPQVAKLPVGAISSVVPAAEQHLRSLLSDEEVISISEICQNLLTGMDRTMGADRVADAVPALDLHGKGRTR